MTIDAHDVTMQTTASGLLVNLPGGPSIPILGITFNYNSHDEQADGSDNWPFTWSDDDHQYGHFGDGGGFGGTDTIGRVSFGVGRIEGTFSANTGFNVYGGLNPENPSTIAGKGHGASISIGGVIYFWVTPSSGTSGYASSTLNKSTDKCATISEVSPQVQFTNAGEGVAFLSFVNYGQDNTSAVDGFVYTTCIGVVSDTALQNLNDNIYLLRCPIGEIETQGSWEWYAGGGTWGGVGSRVAVYTNVGSVGAFPQLIHVPMLNRYVLTMEYGGFSSDLRMLDAPNVYGPFTQFLEEANWGVFSSPQVSNGTSFQWNFMPKFFRNSVDFTLTFSGTGADDSYNAINGSFVI